MARGRRDNVETQRVFELAGAFIQARDFAGAEAVLNDLLARAPRGAFAAAHNLIGVARQSAGDFDGAIVAYERALALAPDDDATHNNLGYLLVEMGVPKRALPHLVRATTRNPANAMAWTNRGNAQRELGDLSAAREAYKRAVALDARCVPALLNLGVMDREIGASDRALVWLARAVSAAPEHPQARQLAADTVAEIAPQQLSSSFAPLLANLLSGLDIDASGAASAGLALLRLDPSFQRLERSAQALDEDLRAPDLGGLGHPLVRGVLSADNVADAAFEDWQTMLRDALARLCQSPTLEATIATRVLPLAVALAHRLWLADYPLPSSGAPTVVAPNGSPRALQIAVGACYAALTNKPDVAGLERLTQTQIEERDRQQRIAASLPTLSDIDAGVSTQVGAQYETSPYPRWRAVPVLARRYDLRRMLAQQFPHVRDQIASLPAQPAILIAGCGTGRHAMIAARLHPGSRILAIDLSRTSLAYAVDAATRAGVTHVVFAQADILRLGAIEERFDLIESAGVLHHLADPVAGWRVLVGLLNPGGVMKIALYSELARADVVAARERIGVDFNGETSDAIRRARALIRALPEGDPARGVLARADFYSLPECRDLILHVQEHRLDCARLAQAIAELGLEFIGFEHPDARVHAQYRELFPQDPNATSLENWGQFEAAHLNTFSAMYQFWVRRSS